MEEKTTTTNDIQKPKRRALDSRIVKSFLAGILLTLVSLAILGFNLSTGGTIKATDDINRYFDTCVGEGFASNTPRIQIDERGFPLSYYQTSRVPVCENTGVELKRNTSSSIVFGALGANVLFWTCLTFVILRKYGRRSAQ
jgi:hypothetical protein